MYSKILVKTGFIYLIFRIINKRNTTFGSLLLPWNSVCKYNISTWNIPFKVKKRRWGSTGCHDILNALFEVVRITFSITL